MRRDISGVEVEEGFTNSEPITNIGAGDKRGGLHSSLLGKETKRRDTHMGVFIVSAGSANALANERCC